MPRSTTATLVGAAALSGVSLVLQGALSDLAYLVGFGAVVAVALRSAMTAHDRRSWLPIAATLAVWWVGDALYALLEAFGSTSFLTVSEVFWLAGYPLLLLGVLRMVRRRAPWALAECALDAVVLTAALGLAVWTFLLAPAMGTMALVEVVVQVVYPCGDALLFAALVLLLLSPGRSGRSGALLAGSMALTLAGDISAVFEVGRFVDPLLLLANTLIAAAIAHPDRDHVSAPVDASQRGRLHTARVVFLGVSLWCPTVVAAVDLGGGLGEATAVVLGATVVCGAASARFVLSNRRREQAEEALQRRATQDSLTGLANRRTLEDALDDLDRPLGAARALVYLDLDHFKPINDRLGHRGGDTVLLAVATRLQALADTEPDTVVARVGGDEFAVLVAADPERAETLAELLVQAVGAQVQLDDEMVAVGASVGVVHWEGSTTSLAALHAADTVMYRAKRSGGGWCSAPLSDVERGDVGAVTHHSGTASDRRSQPRAASARPSDPAAPPTGAAPPEAAFTV